MSSDTLSLTEFIDDVQALDEYFDFLLLWTQQKTSRLWLPDGVQGFFLDGRFHFPESKFFAHPPIKKYVSKDYVNTIQTSD